MTNDDLKRFYPVNGNPDRPESFVRYDKDGNIPGGGSGGAQIEKLDLVVGDPEVIYDTTDGITITSQGQITQGGTTYNVDVEQNIPIIAGEGITIDASEDGKSIVVKKELTLERFYSANELYSRARELTQYSKPFYILIKKGIELSGGYKLTYQTDSWVKTTNSGLRPISLNTNYLIGTYGYSSGGNIVSFTAGKEVYVNLESNSCYVTCISTYATSSYYEFTYFNPYTINPSTDEVYLGY